MESLGAVLTVSCRRNSIVRCSQFVGFTGSPSGQRLMVFSYCVCSAILPAVMSLLQVILIL